MFDLETAIRQWKKALAANPGLEDGQRAELETCLRDEVADLVRRGRSPEAAFRQVTTEMGSADEMGLEFFKVYAKRRFGPPSWKHTRFSPALVWNYIIIALRKIRREKIQDRNIQKLHWPPRDIKPISEFSDTKIFCLAFPWLFPGGIGDIKESRECDIDIADWAQNLLFYEDGRFAKDNLWCFFVLNYIQRHRNKSQSRWFVSDFVGDSPPNLETLQTKLLSGDQSFIDKLMYFGKVVPASNAYWRSKKAELYSWINHHIEKGRGPPNIFMTLSCAEYFWPDLKRLLEHYIYITEGTKVDLDVNLHKLHQALMTTLLLCRNFSKYA